MEKIELTDDQILDLVFDKKIIYGNIEINAMHNALCFLSKLDQRLRDDDIIGSETSVFCRSDGSHDTSRRKPAVIRGRIPKTRKNCNAEV